MLHRRCGMLVTVTVGRMKGMATNGEKGCKEDRRLAAVHAYLRIRAVGHFRCGAQGPRTVRACCGQRAPGPDGSGPRNHL
jgi:hypothetical protein